MFSKDFYATVQRCSNTEYVAKRMCEHGRKSRAYIVMASKGSEKRQMTKPRQNGENENSCNETKRAKPAPK